MKQYLFLLLFIIGISGISARTVIRIDGRSPGLKFEGIGAVSAGASSRLLIDYPEPYRSDILDFLFKPYFGASLQHFKFELGGDVNSTCGTEPSHARTRQEMMNPIRLYFERGYEWWLAREALKRNRNMFFDILQWGAPGWFDEGFYSKDNAEYLASYIKGMKRYHNIDIAYCGLWNEKHIPDLSRNYAVNILRPVLVKNRLEKVKIVGNDMYCSSPKHHEPWSYARELLNDSILKENIDILGYHYLNVDATQDVKLLDMPVWESEASILSGNWEDAHIFAQNTNRNYIRSRAVKTLIWCPVNAYFPNVSWNGVGAMEACMPWCGYYDVRPAIWAIAHTTQFADPGWRYLDDACGETGTGLSYVTLKHPRKELYSMIIVTGNRPDTLVLDVSLIGLTEFCLWKSDEKDQFIRQTSVPVKDGRLILNLAPDAIYSLTNTVGQKKGKSIHPIPAKSEFPAYYTEDFESYERSYVTPRWLSDQGGAFEVVKLPDGNRVLQQQITDSLICWDPWGKNDPEPYTQAGSSNGSNYVVSADFRIGEQGCARIFGVVSWFESNTAPHGIGLEITHSGEWKLSINQKVIKEGVVEIDSSAWNHFVLECGISEVRAIVNNCILADIPADRNYVKGFFGVGSDWNKVCFDNLQVRPLNVN